jgi:O-antigen ligase
VLYLATGAALVLVSGRESREAILLGTLAGVAAVCLAGLADVAVGGDPVGAFTADPGSEGRLAEPVGYSNALAVIAAMGGLIAFGLGLTARGGVRIAYLAAIPLFVVTLFLTYSRGGWLALAVGLVAMLALRLPALDRRIAIPLAAGVVLAALVAVVAVARGFDSSTTTPSSGVSRLTTVSGSNRGEYWGVAWRDVENHPAVGSGAGSWGRYWLRERPVPQPARDAHSLFLETLAELGPLGLALLPSPSPPRSRRPSARAGIRSLSRRSARSPPTPPTPPRTGTGSCRRRRSRRSPAQSLSSPAPAAPSGRSGSRRPARSSRRSWSC